MEGEDEERVEQTARKDRTVIKIPSFQEVLESSLAKSNPSSFFAPSQTFSQAFSFLKSSEFYAPASTSSASSSFASVSASQASENAASRQIGQLDASSSSSSAFAAAPSTPSLSSASNSNQSRKAILVSHRQKGNPLLKHIKNVRWDFADVIPDYILGQSSCALYLSLRYHLLHPDYLYYRIRELQKNFKLCIVLCHVDVEDVVKPLLEVTKTALLHDWTLLCAWSLEECGRYLETIKVYENKPADIIQGQMDTDYLSRLAHALTSVRRVNKTDVVTLGTTFGSLSNIMNGSMEDLARCPGIGERKVRRLYDTFHEPFKRVIPSQPAIFDPSTQKNAETLKVSEEKVDNTEDTSNQKQKEPEVTVKSALSAAFAKYADKVGKKDAKVQGEKTGKKDAKVQGEKTEQATAHANTENENNDS